MDDLTNRIAALVEEHVKKEIEARLHATVDELGRKSLSEVRTILSATDDELVREAASRVVYERDYSRAELNQARMDIAGGLERERKLAENLEKRSDAVRSLRAEVEATRTDLATARAEAEKAREDRKQVAIAYHALRSLVEEMKAEVKP